MSLFQTIANAERLHQQRAVKRSSRAIRSLRLLLFILVLFFAVSTILVQFLISLKVIDISNILSRLSPQNREIVNVYLYWIPLAVLLPVTLVWHFRLLVRVLSLSAHTIVREYTTGAWETLILTHVTARNIVLGKWWAIVRCWFREYLILAVLRISVILWFGLVYSNYVRDFTTNRLGFRPPNFRVTMPELLMLCLSILLFTLINLPCTAAFGVLGGILYWRSGLIISFVVRVATLFVIAAPLIIGGTLMIQIFSPEPVTVTFSTANSSYQIWLPPGYGTPYWALSETFKHGGFALIDNGSLLHLTRLNRRDVSVMGVNFDTSTPWNAFALGLLLYAAVTLAVLLAAERVAVRFSGFSPHKPPHLSTVRAP